MLLRIYWRQSRTPRHGARNRPIATDQNAFASSQDLGTVKNNLARGLYNGKPHELIADVELVFHNCQTYTGYDKTSE